MVGTLTAKPRHILLAGGGHAHVVALQLLSRRPLPEGARITLANPSPYNFYSGALPGVVAGHWPAADIAIDLPALCRAAGASFVEASVNTIDPHRKFVRFSTGQEMPFDILSLDIGSEIRQLNVSDPKGSLVPVRPAAAFLKRWQEVLGTFRKTGETRPVVVIGAGLAGIEVSLAIRHRVAQEFPVPPEVYLIEAGTDIAAGNHPRLRRALWRAVDRAGIICLTGTSVQSIENGSVVLSDNRTIAASLIVNCAGASPHDWLASTGLHTVNGFVDVNACLQSTSHPHIWAAGDTAHYSPAPLPPAGVFAVRAGPVIAENIRRACSGAELSEFRPRPDYLKLVSLGSRRAIGEKHGLMIEGAWVWHLKKWIDFSFLRRHTASASN